MANTTIWTTTYYTAVGTDYCWIYGCADYNTTDYNDKVRVGVPWVGEAWTEGPGTYTENASSTTTVKVNGTTCTTGTLSDPRTKTIAEGVWTYVKAGGTKDNHVDVAKGKTAKTVNLVLTYTIRGNSYTRTVSLNIPALASYTVSYNANGGTGTMSASTKWYGESLTLKPNTFQKDGYTFQGWATSADGSIAYSDGAPYTDNDKATLYAQWKKDITISYNANGGLNPPASETKTVWNSTTSATFTIPQQTPTKQYYKFVKWTTGQGGTGDSYYPNTKYSFSTSRELYAQWKEDYIPPQIPGSPTAYRTDSTFTSNDGVGTFGLLTFTWDYGSLSGQVYTNTDVDVKYRRHTGEGETEDTWKTLTNISLEDQTFLAHFGGAEDTAYELLADKQYDIVISLSDTGFTPNVYTTFISSEDFVIDVNEDGTAVGLLEAAPDNGEGVFYKSKELCDLFYPVGSYYETSDSTFDPNTAWGGTWELEASGQFHLSAGTGYTLGSTGGAATVTLTAAQMPSHVHQMYYYNASGTESGGYVWQSKGKLTNATEASAGMKMAGSGQAHENMPPYIAVNRWHRTA